MPLPHGLGCFLVTGGPFLSTMSLTVEGASSEAEQLQRLYIALHDKG